MARNILRASISSIEHDAIMRLVLLYGDTGRVALMLNVSRSTLGRAIRLEAINPKSRAEIRRMLESFGFIPES